MMRSYLKIDVVMQFEKSVHYIFNQGKRLCDHSKATLLCLWCGKRGTSCMALRGSMLAWLVISAASGSSIAAAWLADTPRQYAEVKRNHGFSLAVYLLGHTCRRPPHTEEPVFWCAHWFNECMHENQITPHPEDQASWRNEYCFSNTSVL